MTTTIEYSAELHLKQLQNQMRGLCLIRADRIAKAEEAIRRANIEFDRDALKLGRDINKLQAQLKPDKSPEPTPRKLDTGSHDPEWSDEDIDHYYELKRGVNGHK